MIYLLFVIALVEILRLVIPYLPTTEKRHFKQKMEGVQKMVWDLNFKIFKSREIREGIRVLYDQNKARLSTIETSIKDWPKEKDIGDRKRLEDQVVLLKKYIERNESQLKSLDREITGEKPSPEYPEGMQGINDQVDSLQELKQMLKDWTKTL